MWEHLTAVRDLGRVHDLASILVHYGFGDMVRRLGLVAVVARAGKVLPLSQLSESAALPAPVRVRRALEDMGPTFVKLGQVLATRVDLFSPEWIAEFGKLHSQAPAVPYEAIHEQLVEDLGAPPEEVFRHFEKTAVAAASIAQVHRATLKDGQQVVVKVRRPGIRPVIEADLRLLQRAAQLFESQFPEWRQFQPVGVVKQFRASLMLELDLAAECRHAERIAANFEGHPEIVVPPVHWDFTSERVNVQDYIDGIPVADTAALDAAGVDRKLIARRGAQTILKMVLEDGFFHADPHPGNVFVLPDSRIAVIDYGMVGRLSQARRDQIVALLHGLVDHDPERVGDVLMEWTGQSDADEGQLTQDIDGFVERYHGVRLGDLDLAAMLLEVTALLRTHKLALPSDLALLAKVFITLEGLGRKLDPDFDMAREAAPFLRTLMFGRYRPRALARQGWHVLGDTARFLGALPRDLQRIVRVVRGGKLKVHIDIDHLKEFSAQIDHSTNRLTVGVVLAALIVGSSITLTVKGGPTLMGLPLFGLLGFLGAALAGAWLVYSIWRSGGGR